MRVLCFDIKFLGWGYVPLSPEWWIRRKLRRILREYVEGRDGHGSAEMAAIKVYRAWRIQRGHAGPRLLESIRRESQTYVESLIEEMGGYTPKATTGTQGW